LELQPGGVDRGADDRVGGGRPREGAHYIHPHQPAGSDQADEGGADAGPDGPVGGGAAQAAVVLGAGAERPGQCRGAEVGGGRGPAGELGQGLVGGFGGRRAQVQPSLGGGSPGVAAGVAADAAAARPQTIVGDEIAGGALGAG